MSFNINDIKFIDPSPELFSTIAKNAADCITDRIDYKKMKEKKSNEIMKNEKLNKSTQLRKYYDELVMWYDKINRSVNRENTYEENAIFIQMLKAKVAYAYGRDYVNDDYQKIFNQVITQIKDVKTLKMAKLFMEAVMGYCKFYDNKK